MVEDVGGNPTKGYTLLAIFLSWIYSDYHPPSRHAVTWSLVVARIATLEKYGSTFKEVANDAVCFVPSHKAPPRITDRSHEGYVQGGMN